MTALLLVAGLVLLTVGAEILLRSASKLAAAARVSPLVIGLTVVAYGTSTPELVVSVQSAVRGQPDIALGNVVGSNIFNVLFILGVSALIVPMAVSQRLVRFEVPLMIGLSVAVLLLGVDGRIGRGDGTLLACGLVAYTIWAIVQSRKEQQPVRQEDVRESGLPESRLTVLGILLHVLLVVAGLLVLVLGARWFTDAASGMARTLGVSELVIGLTIVAAGTSLPEVATSVLAVVRGERDIAVGNVVGSNLFNIMGGLGLSGLVSPEGIAVSQAALSFDIPVMIAVAVACLPIFFTGYLIARWEGGLFVAYCILYTAWLVLAATDSNIGQRVAVAVLVFLLPLTALTLLIGVVRSRKSTDANEQIRG